MCVCVARQADICQPAERGWRRNWNGQTMLQAAGLRVCWPRPPCAPRVGARAAKSAPQTACGELCAANFSLRDPNSTHSRSRWAWPLDGPLEIRWGRRPTRLAAQFGCPLVMGQCRRRDTKRSTGPGRARPLTRAVFPAPLRGGKNSARSSSRAPHTSALVRSLCFPPLLCPRASHRLPHTRRPLAS